MRAFRKIFPGVLIASTVIFLVSCGSSNEQPASEPANPPTTTKPVSGADLYQKNCSACHQANGMGIAKTFPPLVKSDFLANKEGAIDQVINGRSGELVVNGEKYNNTMPPQNLSDDEIASVLTYVYTEFNGGGSVTADEVKAVRSKAK